jgi:hypothetical protein
MIGEIPIHAEGEFRQADPDGSEYSVCMLIRAMFTCDEL